MSLAIMALYATVFFRDDENPVTCVTLNVLFRFFLQATFIWTALAGALFYLTSHDEHTSTPRIRPRALLLTGWGCAAVGMVASVAGVLCGCSTSTGSCWLSCNNVFFWEFMGPVVYMLVIKTLMTCRVTRWTGGQDRKLNNQETIKIRSALLVVAVLELLVCLLWILGRSYLPDGNIFLANAFVTLNSMQGFFVFYPSFLSEEEVATELHKTEDSSTEPIKNEKNNVFQVSKTGCTPALNTEASQSRTNQAYPNPTQLSPILPSISPQSCPVLLSSVQHNTANTNKTKSLPSSPSPLEIC